MERATVTLSLPRDQFDALLSAAESAMELIEMNGWTEFRDAEHIVSLAGAIARLNIADTTEPSDTLAVTCTDCASENPS